MAFAFQDSVLSTPLARSLAHFALRSAPSKHENRSASPRLEGSQTSWVELELQLLFAPECPQAAEHSLTVGNLSFPGGLAAHGDAGQCINSL